MAKNQPTSAPVEEEAVETAEKDYSTYITKPTGALYPHLLGWIKDKTGVSFTTKKEQEAFDLGVKLTLALRTAHQSSDENQQRLADAKTEREEALAAAAEAKAEEAKAPKPEKAAPAEKTGKGKKAPAATPAEVPVAPAKGPKKAAAVAGGKKAPF